MKITERLDVTKEHCPMTFVKTRLALEKMNAGEILEVILTEGEPLTSVPRSAKDQGFEVLGISHIEGNVHRVLIRK